MSGLPIIPYRNIFSLQNNKELLIPCQNMINYQIFSMATFVGFVSADGAGGIKQLSRCWRWFCGHYRLHIAFRCYGFGKRTGSLDGEDGWSCGAGCRADRAGCDPTVTLERRKQGKNDPSLENPMRIVSGLLPARDFRGDLIPDCLMEGVGIVTVIFSCFFCFGMFSSYSLRSTSNRRENRIVRGRSVSCDRRRCA